MLSLVLSSPTTAIQSADTTERFTKRIVKCGKVFRERYRDNKVEKIIEENENEPGYLKFRRDNGEIMH